MVRSISGGTSPRLAGVWDGLDRWRYHREARSGYQRYGDRRGATRGRSVPVRGKRWGYDLCQWGAWAIGPGFGTDAPGAGEPRRGGPAGSESSVSLDSYRIGNLARQAPSGIGHDGPLRRPFERSAPTLCGERSGGGDLGGPGAPGKDSRPGTKTERHGTHIRGRPGAQRWRGLRTAFLRAADASRETPCGPRVRAYSSDWCDPGRNRSADRRKRWRTPGIRCERVGPVSPLTAGT